VPWALRKAEKIQGESERINFLILKKPDSGAKNFTYSKRGDTTETETSMLRNHKKIPKNRRERVPGQKG